MTALVTGAVRLASLAGINLSPFFAGAILAAIAAIGITGAGVAGGVHLYNKGYAAADGAWRERALESQIEALKRDRDVARQAAADEALRAAALQQQADEDREGTQAYVEELAKNGAGKCALSCDDLRGMRIKSAACPAAAGPAAATRKPAGAGGNASRRLE